MLQPAILKTGIKLDKLGIIKKNGQEDEQNDNPWAEFILKDKAGIIPRINNTCSNNWPTFPFYPTSKLLSGFFKVIHFRVS